MNEVKYYYCLYMISIPILLMGSPNQFRNYESVTFTFSFLNWLKWFLAKKVSEKSRLRKSYRSSLFSVPKSNFTKSKQTTLKNSGFIVLELVVGSRDTINSYVPLNISRFDKRNSINVTVFKCSEYFSHSSCVSR